LLRFIFKIIEINIYLSIDFNTTLVKVHPWTAWTALQKELNFNTTLVKVHPNLKSRFLKIQIAVKPLIFNTFLKTFPT